MDELAPAAKTTNRRRPTPTAWAEAMTMVFAAHEAHGRLPFHVLMLVGEQFGVAARSLETRYGLHLAALEAASGWRLGPDAIAEIAGAVGDFPEAYARLSSGCDVPGYPLVDRAIWRDVSRALVGLRVAERRRRQKLDEAGECAACGFSAPAVAA